MKQNIQKRRRFPVWGWFFVFFGVLFIANGFLIYFATTSFTGVSSTNAYAEGIAYEDELQRQKRQAEEGWRFAVHDVIHRNACFLIIDVESDVFSKEDIQKSGGDMQAILYRPTHEGMDIKIPLHPVVNTPGQFRSCGGDIPEKGVWDVKVTFDFEGHIYKHQKRIVLN